MYSHRSALNKQFAPRQAKKSLPCARRRFILPQMKKNRLAFVFLQLCMAPLLPAHASSGVHCKKALQIPIAAPKACKRAAFCAHLPKSKSAADYSDAANHFFQEFKAACPEYIWQQDLPEELRTALEDYTAKRKTASGKEYGASVRGLKLEGKNEAELRSELRRLDCSAKTEPAPPNREIFRCGDGGIVVIFLDKSVDKKIAQKAVLYPMDSEPEEAQGQFFVDETGIAIPGKPENLALRFKDKAVQADFTAGWNASSRAFLKK